MWLMKIFLLVSLFGFVDSYAGPRNFGFKVHKHIIEVEVTDISVEQPLPHPRPADEEEMVAKVHLKYY